MLQALGQHRLYSVGDLGDQHRVGGVRGGGFERVADADHPAVDAGHVVDEQAEQGGDGEDDDEAENDRPHPERVLGTVHGAYPPSRARPRCRPPIMTVAYSIVVRSAASGAVLSTALASSSLIFGASLPMDRASKRIGTTSATTTS